MKNLVDLIQANAARFPQREAIRSLGDGTSMTYAEFMNAVQASRDRVRGPRRRVLVLHRPDRNLLIQLIALMAEGSTLLFVDPSLKFSEIRAMLPRLRAEALILQPSLSWIKLILPPLWRLPNLRTTARTDMVPWKPTVSFADDDVALESLTSGTTGPCKIVPITFSTMRARQEILHKYLPPADPDIHWCGYLLSCLQNLTEAATSVIPPSRKPLEMFESFPADITRVSGPPGDLAAIAELAIHQGRSFRSVQSVLLGGAPVPTWLLEKLQNVFPRGHGHVIYGSTESEPIAFSSFEKIRAHDVSGYPVGRALDTELDIKPLAAQLLLPVRLQDRFARGLAGELWLSGPHVVRHYRESAAEEAAVKDHRADGSVWHKTGDLVFFDAEGLVLLGRSKDAVMRNGRLLPNLMLEADIEKIPGIARACLIADGEAPRLVMELSKAGSVDRRALKAVLDEWDCGDLTVDIQEHLAVDSRHRWKLQREAIKAAKSSRF